MRRQIATVGVVSVLAAGCTPDSYALELKLPEVEDAKSLIVSVQHGVETARFSVVDLVSAEGLASVPTIQSAESITEVTALYYAESLAELGLEPGANPPEQSLRPVFFEGYHTEIEPVGESRVLEPNWVSVYAQDDLPAGLRAAFYGDCRFLEFVEGRECLPELYCQNGSCERDFCWTTPVEVAGFDEPEGYIDSFSTPVIEDGELWLYFRTTRGASTSTSSDHPWNRHARVKMLDPTTIDPGTLEFLSTGDFDGKGGSIGPRIANAGHEMFFHSDRDDAVWWDREVYLGSRDGPTGVWGQARMVVDFPAEGVTCSRILVDGTVHASTSIQDPVLLPDRRRLVLWQDNLCWPVIYRRASADPGDTSFAYIGQTLNMETAGIAADAVQVFPASMSCDGAHLFYIRRRRDGGNASLREPRVAELADLDDQDVSFQNAQTLDLPSGSDEDRLGLLHFAEHPDCSHIYLSDFTTTWVAEAIPCSD